MPTTVAHILSHGPSVLHAEIPHDRSIIIGSNTVGRSRPDIPLDWLCFGDDCIWHDLKTGSIQPPCVGYIVQQRNIGQGLHLQVTKGRQFLPWEWLWMPEDLACSAHVAIWAAVVMRCTEIHLWGFDHQGDLRADGSYADVYDGIPRWDREPKFFERTRCLAHDRGAVTIRH